MLRFFLKTVSPVRILFAACVAAVALTFGALSCRSGSTSPDSLEQPDSHTRMIALLGDLQRKFNRSNNVYCSEARLAHFDSLLAVAKQPGDQLNLAFLKAGVLLEYGDEKQAAALYDRLLESVGTDPKLRSIVQSARGMAYLRLAERQNCVLDHGAEACVLPIRGDGVHRQQEASKIAVDAFSEVLKLDPNNLDARWLLNIACMTLGEYPARVPTKWLIRDLDAPGAVRVRPFANVASALKVETNDRAGGVIVDDFDNDGLLDVATSAWGLDDPMHLFRNNGDGTFSDVSAASGLDQITGGLNMVSTDYNNDGNVDIFVLRGGWQGQAGFGEQPRSLLRNNGDGTFTDVTIDAGLLSLRPTQTATWNDFNNDGWLDVFIGNETSETNRLYPCQLYINNGNGTFTDIAPGTLNINAFVKGVTSGDYDNDGWPDLFLSTFNGQKLLLRNRGALPGGQIRFDNVTAAAGLGNEHYRSFTTWFFDYDNDGWLDLFTCNYEFERPLSYYAAKEAVRPSADRTGKIFLYRNNGNGTFTNVSPKLRAHETVFSMGGNFGDIDNDGWLDLYLGTGNPNYQSLVPNRMFKNVGGKDFVDVTASARVGNLQKGHGIGFGDLDNDGQQDIYADLGGAYRGDGYHSSFFLNPGQNNDNNWIYLRLEGRQTNRAAIGAKITVRFTENGVRREVYREVNTGGSFGCSTLRREIGIGKAAVIDEIAVTWPVSRTAQVIRNVQPGQLIRIVEGETGYTPLPLRNLNFKKLANVAPMCQ